MSNDLSAAFAKTDRNKVHRIPDRARYDRETIYRIVDEALICHVGFVDGEQPFVIPTIHARQGDRLILHGAKASRLLKWISLGHPICVTVTLLDGLVMARSVFHHSMNYRSAVMFGRGSLIEQEAEKMAAMQALVEHVARGRWEESRQPNRRELKATKVVAMSIDSATAKVRTGPPVDDDEDYELPYWAGILPIKQQVEGFHDDPKLTQGIEVPDNIRFYSRPV